MLTQMIRIEHQKLTRRTMFWIDIALMAGAILLVTFFLFVIKQMLDSGISEQGGFRIEGIDSPQALAMLTWPTAFLQILSIASSWGSFLIVVLSGAVMAQEYSWRSFQLWLSRGVPRWSVMVAKFAAVAFTALMLIGTAVVLGGVLTGILSLVYLDSLPFAAVAWGKLLLASLAAAYTLLPYAVFAMLLAIVSRSTALTVGGGLAFVTLIEPLGVQLLPLLGDVGQTIASYFPASLSQVVMGSVVGQIPADAVAQMSSGGMATSTAVFLLGMYTLLGVATAVGIFQRQELGG